MTQFSLQMGMSPVIISGLLQGFGLGRTFVPLNIIALSNLPRHILTQGTAIRSLMRNLGRSFPHFDTITVCVADAPRPDEIVVVMAIAEGGRLRNRCGTESIRKGLKLDEAGFGLKWLLRIPLPSCSAQNRRASRSRSGRSSLRESYARRSP
jgi:hypothetical protein